MGRQARTGLHQSHNLPTNRLPDLWTGGHITQGSSERRAPLPACNDGAAWRGHNQSGELGIGFVARDARPIASWRRVGGRSPSTYTLDFNLYKLNLDLYFCRTLHSQSEYFETPNFFHRNDFQSMLRWNFPKMKAHIGFQFKYVGCEFLIRYIFSSCSKNFFVKKEH